MKKITVAFTVSLFLAAAALVAFFVLLWNIGKFNEGGDLSAGLSAFFTVLLTAIPVICDLPVALALVIVAICLLTRRKKYGSAVAAVVILSVFLPVLLFSGILNLTTIGTGSVPYALLVALFMAIYLAAFAFAIVHLVALRRERRRIAG